MLHLLPHTHKLFCFRALTRRCVVKPAEYDRAMQKGRMRGALLGLAVGDALGTTLEFERPPLDRPWRLLTGPHRDVTGGGPFGVEAGQVTDDTQMAACLAASLASQGRFSRDDLTRAYLSWEQHAFDIGALTSASLARARADSDADAGRRAWETSGRQSAGNGSLMRTAPIGVLLWHDFAARRHASLADSAITHFDPRCQLACAAFNAAIARAIATQEPAGSPRVLHDAAGLELRAAAELLRARHPDLVAVIDASEEALAHDLHLATLDDPELWDLLHAAQGFVRVSFRLAFWHLLHAPSFEAALIDAVNRGGDADTNAAISGALLGAYHGADAIPARWSAPVLAALSDRAGHPLRDLYHPRVLLSALDAPVGSAGPLADPDEPEEASERFFWYEPEEQSRLIWEELIGKGALAWDVAIRTAARGLRDKGLLAFDRLIDTSPAYALIRRLIEIELRAELPLFDRGDHVRGQVRAIVAGAHAISREQWRDFLLAVVGSDPIDREEAIRLSAELARSILGLSFQRLRCDGVIAGAIESALNGAVRTGHLARVGAGRVARASEGLRSPDLSWSTCLPVFEVEEG
jgi:ADP-ribosyl-[dinitrogen reductase] hydrolase